MDPTFPSPPRVTSPTSKQCETDALDWGIFVLTMINLNVTWWLFHLPALFREGFKCYLHDVAWECLRVHLPSRAALTSTWKQEHKYWHMCYYSGIHKEATLGGYIKDFVKDSFIFVTTCLSIYRLCRGGSTQDVSGLNSSLWMYPSLPVAVYGVWITIAAWMRVKRWVLYTVGLLILSIILTAMALTINFLYRNNIWIGSTLAIVFMAFPLFLISHRFILFGVAFGSFARIGGPLAGALNSGAYFPFCSARGWGFAGPVMALGIVSALLALFASIRMEPRKPIQSTNGDALDLNVKTSNAENVALP
ncbi:hypothetical protein BU17DRAFT_57103 [Hysterangium stoloniferum]|nr:hypothetical protein BU17DRAFT_57103 [Hysterangium stoloniferum]